MVNEDFKSLEIRIYTDAPGMQTRRYLEFSQNGKTIYTAVKEVNPSREINLVLTRQELMFFVGRDAGETFDIEYSERGNEEKLIVFKLAFN
ncbi:hypothetical protein [uncultured Flavobacterium sp.]|uniref:hypothetical protein n=1 Tax=uncultured Flavobacterium sp. TaxID=165435 RepID=UPI0025FE84D0|nr:hypothetical protein [uncultured Flavobacterium sp.]